MASLTIARPGKVSERQYLGDLAGLFNRQRRRAGVALTPDSFAADLAASDSLRSGLFTLCTAISRMGEHDLSPEELLGLVVRALGDAGSAEGEAGTPIPEAMREAFLSGYGAWRHRDTQPITDLNAPEEWPPDSSARKPPMSEGAQETTTAAAVNGPAPDPIARRTVQEALSRIHRDRDPDSTRSTRPGEDLGSVTLGELKEFLEEIEHRVSRLGPHIHQLSASVARETARRERSTLPPTAIIPFPQPPKERRKDSDRRKSSRRRDAAQHTPAEDALLAQADERPRGIDALLRAAQAWAKATPPARPANAAASLTLDSATWSAANAASHEPAQPVPSEDPAQALSSALPQGSAADSLSSAAVTPAAQPDRRETPVLSAIERLQAAIFRLPPRNVFLVLVGLTLLAGCLAGYMAYRALHPAHVQFKNMQFTVAFGASPASAASSTTPVQQTSTALQSPTGAVPNPASPVMPAHKPSPAVPFATATDKGTVKPASAPASTVSAASATGASETPLYVPAPTMIAYTLASPQPVAPSGPSGKISGTVPVEITISRLGDITAAHTLGGPPELGAAAVTAARAWRFRPYLVDGKATPVTTTLQFYFKGDDSASNN